MFKLRLGKRDVLSLTIPILLGFVSMAAWLVDLYMHSGWFHVDWQSHQMNSVYLITGTTILSYVLPQLIHEKARKWYFFIPGMVFMYIVSLYAFHAVRDIFTEIYSFPPAGEHAKLVLKLFGIGVLVAAVLFYVKQNIMIRVLRSEFDKDRDTELYNFTTLTRRRTRPFHILSLLMAFISVIPASIISVEWVYNLGEKADFSEAVKMGYPFFWINIFLAYLNYLTIRKII